LAEAPATYVETMFCHSCRYSASVALSASSGLSAKTATLTVYEIDTPQ
jgi:hypothetical protein